MKGNDDYNLEIEPEYCDNKIENNTGSNDNLILFYNDTIDISDKNASQLILCEADHSTIDNITVSSQIEEHYTDKKGILLYDTDHANITNSESSNNSYGIKFFSSSENNIINSIVSSNDQDGISFKEGSENNQVINSSINSNYRGLELISSSNNHLERNEIKGNYEDGIYSVSGSDENKIIKNVIKNNDLGIILSESSNNNKIVNNYLSLNQETGILLSDSSNHNNIMNNTLLSNGKGISIEQSSGYNKIFDNDATNNYVGIYISNTGYENNITENLFCSNDDYDIKDEDNNEFNKNRCNTTLDGEGCYYTCQREIQVNLEYPDKNHLFTQNEVLDFNISASADEGLKNCTLWTNLSGVWKANETRSLSENSAEINWEIHNVTNGEYIWNAECCIMNDCVINPENYSFSINSTLDPSHEVENCRNIASPGNYVVSKDLSPNTDDVCINISSDNVTLDCSNHSINGEGGVGIYLNHNNITVKNCRITGMEKGILINSSNNNGLYNNTVQGNNKGIYMSKSSDNSIISNTLKENSEQDLMLNTVSEEDCDNNITNNMGSGNNPILYYNHTTKVSDRTSSQIILCDADHSNINNITISGVNSIKNNGIYLTQTDNTNITDSESSNNRFGIKMDSSINNTIKRNNLSSNYEGMYLKGSNNTLNNNIMENNEHDGMVVVSQSNQNQLISNRFCGNGDGYYDLVDNDDTTGENNTCNRPKDYNDTGVEGCTHTCHMPRFLNIRNLREKPNEEFVYDIDAIDKDGDNLTFSINNENFTINRTNGVLRNDTPFNRTNASYNIQVNVTDGKDVIEDSFNVTTYITPKMENFSDDLTTNVSELENFTNVSDFTIGKKGKGLINFTEDVNLSYLDFDRYMNISHNWINVSSNQLEGINSSAIITLYGVNKEDPVVYKDGEECDYCNDHMIDTGENVTFRIRGFSNYYTNESDNTDDGSTDGGTDDGSTGGGSSSNEYCGDGTCDEDEDCSTCVEDCGECECDPSWVCGSWSECENGTSTRECFDSNTCGTTKNKPKVRKSCHYCGDGDCNQDENCSTCLNDCGGCEDEDRESENKEQHINSKNSTEQKEDKNVEKEAYLVLGSIIVLGILISIIALIKR